MSTKFRPRIWLWPRIVGPQVFPPWTFQQSMDLEQAPAVSVSRLFVLSGIHERPGYTLRWVVIGLECPGYVLTQGAGSFCLSFQHRRFQLSTSWCSVSKIDWYIHSALTFGKWCILNLKTGHWTEIHGATHELQYYWSSKNGVSIAGFSPGA